MMDQDTFDADVEDAALTSPMHQEKVKGKGSKHPRLKKSSISASSLEDEDMKSASYAARRTKSGASKKSRDNKSKPSSTTTTSSTSSSKPSAADVACMAEAVARTLSTCEWDDNLLVLGTKELNAFLKQGDFTKEQMHRLKVARRRAKNRTYALRSRQKKSGKMQSPCPGPSPMAGTETPGAGEEGLLGGKKPSKEMLTSPLAAPTTMNGTSYSGNATLEALADGSRPVIDIIGSTLAAAGGVIDDDDSASEFEYNLGGPGVLPWSFPDNDDDLSSILSSDTDSLSGSTGTFDGFSTDSFATDDYGSSIDILSSSLDRSQTSNAAFASAAFDRFEALSINAAEQEYQADLGDNFLRCMFANNVAPTGQASLTRSGTVSGVNGTASVPMDVSGLLGGRARSNTHVGVATAGGGSMQQDPGGLVSELDAMMADLREGYSAVHRKIDSMASMLQAPEVVASGGGGAAGSVHASSGSVVGAGLTLTLSQHVGGTSGTAGGMSGSTAGLPGGGIVGMSLPTSDGSAAMVDVPPHTPTLVSMATAGDASGGPPTPGPTSSGAPTHNKQHVTVAAAAATAGAARTRRRSRSTTPTPADGVNVAHLPASLDVVNTIRELKSGFNNLNSKIDAWTHQAGFPLSPSFPAMNLSPDGLNLSPGMGGLVSTAFSFDMDVDPELPKPM